MTRLLCASLMAATALSVTLATPAFARDGGKIGKGDYFIYKAPKIMPNGELVAGQMTTGEGALIVKLDDICRVEAKRQNPSGFKTVFLVALRNAPGAFVGGMIGSKVGGFTKNSTVSALNYGEYNGIATVGGSIGAGINAYEMGKHNNVAGCMMALVSDAKKQGYLMRVYITYNTFPVYGKPLRISNLQPGPLTSKANDGGDSDSDDATSPPPQ